MKTPLDTDIATIRQDDAPSDEWSALQLRERLARDCGEIDPFSPLAAPALKWSPEDISTIFAGALEVFEMHTGPHARRLGKACDGGRTAMVTALDVAIIFLQQHLPVRDLKGLEPLHRLSQIVKDLDDGITDRALQATRGGNNDPRMVVDLKARCLLASDVLRAHGRKKADADRMVITRIATAAQQLEVKPCIENWRRSLRRDAKSRPWQRQWPDNSLSIRLTQLQQELKVHLRLAQSIEGLLDAILPPAAS